MGWVVVRILLCCQIHYSQRVSQNLLPQGQRFGCGKKTIDLCACESEEREHGVGAGANSTLLSDTL